MFFLKGLQPRQLCGDRLTCSVLQHQVGCLVEGARDIQKDAELLGFRVRAGGEVGNQLC